MDMMPGAQCPISLTFLMCGARCMHCTLLFNALRFPNMGFAYQGHANVKTYVLHHLYFVSTAFLIRPTVHNFAKKTLRECAEEQAKKTNPN